MIFVGDIVMREKNKEEIKKKFGSWRNRSEVIVIKGSRCRVDYMCINEIDNRKKCGCVVRN